MTPSQEALLKELEKLTDAAKKMREAVEKVFVLPEDYQPIQESKCPKCGITLSPVMGYVCTQSQCPTGLGGTYSLA